MIEYFVIVLFLLDMILSYLYIKGFRERHSNKDWSVVEANPILRTCIKNIGLEKGMLVGSIILLGILGIIFNYTTHRFKYFLAGLYFMVNVQHLVNYNSIKMLDKIKKKEVKKK